MYSALHGKPADQLTREELLQVVEHLACALEQERGWARRESEVWQMAQKARRAG